MSKISCSNDGDVVLSDSRMPTCLVESSDGDVNVRDSEGSFNITVDDGDVTVESSRLGEAVIRTEDGDVELDLLSSDGIALDVEVEDGDVIVDLEHGFSTTFTITTEDGEISLDLPQAQMTRSDERERAGVLHGGSGSIRIRGHDGTIVLRESN